MSMVTPEQRAALIRLLVMEQQTAQQLAGQRETGVPFNPPFAGDPKRGDYP
jgi:hypothetical protein